MHEGVELFLIEAGGVADLLLFEPLDCGWAEEDAEDEADHDGDDLAEGVLLAGEDAEEAEVVSFEPGEEFFDQQQEHCGFM